MDTCVLIEFYINFNFLREILSRLKSLLENTIEEGLVRRDGDMMVFHAEHDRHHLTRIEELKAKLGFV